jgi:hypothetical protein
MASLRRRIASHPLATAAVIGLFLVVVGVALFWFEPQQLWLDDKVDEPAPGAAAPDPAAEESASDADTSGQDEAPEAEAKTLASGTFAPLDHEAEGKALILDVDGARFLRFEDFEVENGPDLKVYLSSASASADPSTFDDDFVDLGDLKGNIGNQNYKISDDVDLAEYRSVVVWCRRFSVGFAVADLTM